jgi:hypothetical protein
VEEESVSDELRRRFQDKIQGRPPIARRAVGVAGQEHEEVPHEEVPPATILIRALEHDAFPAAESLNPLFRIGVGRIRMTLDFGADLRRRASCLSAVQQEALLAFSPRLDHHDCCLGVGLDALLSITARSPGEMPVAEDLGGADGLPLAHLIEHLALELLADAGGGRECHGATCAHADLPDRFDLYLESPDPILGRTAAILSVVMARDVCAGLDRLNLHLRTRDLLIALASGGRSAIVPEDVALDLGCALPESREALDALARMGYLVAIAAPLTFSSACSVIYRRPSADGTLL